MLDENPHRIQERPAGCPWVKITPLVLIHDGGGTTFSYHCLGNLKRDVYGIANPYYDTDKVWRGGIPEMARTYAQWIKGVVPQGEIILGGWSLGGLISLEVARILAEDSAICVIGIVMIDSVYPKLLHPRVIAQHVFEWGAHTRQETRDAVTRCFSEAHRMVNEWTLPTWGDETPLEDTSETENEGDATDTFSRRASLRASSLRNFAPPPVILLRAAKSVPVLEEGVSRVDIHRTSQLLGWDQYRQGMVTKVLELPDVHHYNLFTSEDALARATEKINEACLDLEAMSSPEL